MKFTQIQKRQKYGFIMGTNKKNTLRSNKVSIEQTAARSNLNSSDAL